MTEINNVTLNFDLSDTSKVLFWFFLSLETISIYVGNVIICCLFCVRKRLRTKQNLFVLSLSVSDLLIGISVPPCEYCAFKLSYPSNCSYICGSIVSFNILASAINLTLIAIDRFFSILMPFTYKKKITWQRAVNMIILGWMFAFFLTLIPFFWMLDTNMARNRKQKINIIFSIVVFSCIVLNGLLIGGIYYKIIQIARWQLQKEINRKVRCTKGIKVCILVAISYFVCWIPTAVTEVLYQNNPNIPREVLLTTYFLLLLNPCFDPLMYGCYRKDYRKELCTLFGFKKNKKIKSIL
ncbi:histamine H2 receptor [Hydra vulgaris]|uniref:Histamine H2 receptor n=1 Tax=Hydra vulgaris TaxID=6087 RepID=A0ABM4DGI4_HYDVU